MVKELHIFPEAKKSAYYESYTRVLEYQLREEGKETIKGYTGSGYMGNYPKPYFGSYIQFLKSLGLSKKDVKVIRHECYYDSGNIH